MMRSLFSGVAGLRAHQTKMDVVGNNIANVNTFGFKASRVTFSDTLYQTLSTGSRPTGAAGGVNPTQIGYGSMVSTIDILNTQSAMATTGHPLDVYITGDGMIAVTDASGMMMFTRNGSLRFDAEGYLVNGQGLRVMGLRPNTSDPTNVFPNGINPDGTADGLETIRIDPDTMDRMTSISIGPRGDIIGLIPSELSDFTINATLSTLAPWISDFNFASVIAGNDDPVNTNLTGAVSLNVVEDGGEFFLVVSGTLMSGQRVSARINLSDIADDGGADETVPFQLEDVDGNLIPGTEFSIVINSGDLYDILDDTALANNLVNNITNVSAGRVALGDPEIYTVGFLMLATFRNNQGLTQHGQSNFVASPNSGLPSFVLPGINGTGTLQSGALEMSNVEIAKEFTDMIITQRGFQANTRIVTVSDEMLNELVNLRR